LRRAGLRAGERWVVDPERIYGREKKRGKVG
jgi:hypothetical protein